MMQCGAQCGASWQGTVRCCAACWRAGLFAVAASPLLAQVSSYGDKASRAGQRQAAGVLNKVGIAQHLNEQLPLALTFTDDDRQAVQLGSYFGKQPAILALVYYQCPMLCSEELNGLTSARCRWWTEVPGKDFDVIVVSIDPTEGTGSGRGQEAQLREALRASGDGRWLAFPDRHAAEYRRADQGGRIRLREDSRAGRQADAVCARQLDPDCDAAGQAGAVLHGRRVFAEGFAAGAGGGFGEQASARRSTTF